MPSTTVPTAPIPVHTAYAVPIGRLRVATPTKPRLSTIMTAVATDGQKRVNPCEYFRPIENPVSNTPAITRTAQAYCFITFLFLESTVGFSCRNRWSPLQQGARWSKPDATATH